MARKKKTSYFMYFDIDSYTKELLKSIREATLEVRKRIQQYARENLAVIPFKTNKVRLAGDKVTSDAARKTALLNSIIQDELRLKGYKAYVTSVSAMANNFKDSHIGIYYEWGTGDNAEDSGIDFPQGDVNPDRNGRTIVSRSRNVSYSGGMGVWKDIGGNLRVTGSPKAGRRDSNFVKYIGDDLEAYHWFQRAYIKAFEESNEIYVKAIMKVNPMSFLHMKNNFKLG